MIELKELYEKVMDVFQITEIEELGGAIMAHINDERVMDAFFQIVEGNLSKDWLKMIYQYYLADRKDKKQDFTPENIASFMGELAGDADVIVDLCAGSGALTIQRWNRNHDQEFELYEIDENVIPYLLFNLAVRNIKSTVYLCDVLQNETKKTWKIRKGEKYGKVSNF